MSKAGAGRKARAYAYTAVTTAIVLIFALVEWAAERFVSEHSRAASIAIEIAVVLVAALVFRPIHARVEAAVEDAFTRREREALRALAAFRRELSSFNDLGQLLRRVIDAVDHQLEAKACAVYLRREEFRAEASSFDVAAGTIEFNDPLVIRLRSSTAPAQPSQLNSSARGTRAFPMTVAGELVGFLSVQARHGEYDDEELAMLSGLAQDLAVAVVALDPALRPQSASVPNNLPADLPTLVGREHERAEIGAAIEHSRLVTIAGTGGVGKTCIALHCAFHELRKHEHGAWFVNLAPIADGALVAPTIASNLGAADVIDYLRDRDLLLVLDNCEQVVGSVAAIAGQILANCPNVKILATSRELLHVSGEQVYRLRPLRTTAAIELFTQRAKAVAPAFEALAHEQAVQTICEQMDGIPLAIELAAARTRALAPEEIVEHLGERFRLLSAGTRTAEPRHQTLEATIAWSYELLPVEEQSLFRRLSAFRGTFSLQAAAAVCTSGGNCDEYHVLDVLTSLADKSLIVVRLGTATRYRLLETLREFAVQKAVEQQVETTARTQHAAFFAAVAAQAYHEFDSRLPAGWLDRLSPDIDNFRAALEWALEASGDRKTGAQLSADCGPIFLRMRLLGEGLRWCDAARSVQDLSHGTAGRIDYVASMLYNNLGEVEPALRCADTAVRHYELSPDRRGLVRALSQVAQQYARAGRFEDALAPADAAIRAARELNEPRTLIAVLRRCAFSLRLEDIERARTLFAEALDVAFASGDREEVCLTLEWWADREAASGALERAIDLATRALEYANVDSRMFLQGNIALWLIALRRLEEAEPHARAALEVAIDTAHPLGLALSLALFAGVHATNDPRQAAILFGYSRKRLAALRWKPENDDELAFDTITAALESRLDTQELANLLQRGEALDQDEATQTIRSCLAMRREAHDAPQARGDGVGTLLR